MKSRKPIRDLVEEIYVDENVDISLVTRRVSHRLRKAVKKYERVVVQIHMEEIVRINLEKKGRKK